MSQGRKHLLDYDPRLIDRLQEEPPRRSRKPRLDLPQEVTKAQQFVANLSRPVSPTGEGGYRAAYILALAKFCLNLEKDKYAVYTVDEKFTALLGPRRPGPRGREPSPRTQLSRALASLSQPRNRPHELWIPTRREGRPRDAKVAARAWTIDALYHRQVCDLSLRQALGLWNRTFPGAAYHCARHNMPRHFYCDRKRIRERLGPSAAP